MMTATRGVAVVGNIDQRRALGTRLAGWLAPTSAPSSRWNVAASVLASVLAVGLVRWLLNPALQEEEPYVLFIAAVVLSTRRGGWKGGAAATVLSWMVGSYLFTEPRYMLWINSVPGWIASIAFIASSAVLVLVLELERASRRELEKRDALIQSEYDERIRLERELEASRRLESLGRLAGGVAHDFNNLLAVTLGSAELLRRDMPHNALLDNIVLAAERSAELTKQLLGLGRRQTLRLGAVSLNELVTQLARLSGQLVPEDVELRLELAPALWSVEADEVQLQQVLLNLITNARDALRAGGTICVQTRNVEVDARFAMRHPELAPGDYVVLSVSDTGPGMTESTLSKVFEPFFSTKAGRNGAGLGLAVTYGLVKQHRGHITAESMPGEGSTFRVYLPRASRELAATEEREPRARREGVVRSLEVLLVEDNELVRKIVKHTLEALGHRVIEAATPQVAIDVASQPERSLDVLLTDVVMPHMNGPELAIQLTTQRPRLSVVYMSGYTDNIILGRGAAGLPHVLLRKPFTQEELEQALHAAVPSERGEAERSTPSFA